MTRVGLISGRTYAYTDPFTLVAGTRTYAEEMTNYANWYAYYRTRVLAAKTTSAIAFGNVDNTYRVGFHSMNLRNAGSTLAEWLDVGDFVSGAGLQRDNWYTKLFGISIGTGMTPTIDAMFRIGEVVKQGAGAVTGLPAHTDPIPTIAGNPVSCTNNYHILFTDGETNQLTLPTVVSEVDGATIPAPRRRRHAPARSGRAQPRPHDGVVRPRHAVADAVPRRRVADAQLAGRHLAVLLEPRPAPRHDQRRAVARRPRGQGSRLEARPGVVAARQLLGHLVRLGRPARLLRRRRQDRRDRRRHRGLVHGAELPASAEPSERSGTGARHASGHRHRRPVARRRERPRHVRVRRDAHRGGVRPRQDHLRHQQQPEGPRRRDVRRPVAPGQQQLHLRGDDRAGLVRRAEEGHDRHGHRRGRRRALVGRRPSSTRCWRHPPPGRPRRSIRTTRGS